MWVGENGGCAKVKQFSGGNFVVQGYDPQKCADVLCRVPKKNMAL